MSTITIASLFLFVGDSDFYDKLNSSLQSTKRDCFTLHENPSLIDLLPGFIWIWERLKRKENSLKTIYLFFWITFVVEELPRCKAIVVQEFWPDSLSLPFTFRWCLTYHLGSTHPYSITVCMEPFSTSVFKFYTHAKNAFLSLEYLLLLPRSVLITISYKITLTFQHYDHIFLQLRTSSLNSLCESIAFVLNSQSKSTISASSIFRTNSFGRWVITHSLADFDFHDHRPTVSMN